MDSGLANAAAVGAVVPLDAVDAADAARVGGKAANLGELKKAAFNVPDGFVVIGEPPEDLAETLRAFGGGPLAVRSSAVAEDLADASFAGQYETFLNVQGLEQLRKAIGDCRRSASSARVASYRANRAEAAPVEIAVLVQRMVPAEAAGVAFTANPVTGDRSEVSISAVRGLGERLVSGEAQADEWVVREGKPQRRRSSEDAITADQAAAVADLARSAAAHFGRPQDVEWAFSGGKLYLLQSRPMTALPSPVDWTAPRVRGFHVPPGPSYWMRNLRLGEWLPEPVTPLFEDWLLKLISRGFGRGTRADSGLLTGLRYAVVNRWFYSTPEPDVRLEDLLTAILTRPTSMFRFASSLIKQTGDPELAERRFFARVVRRWRQQTLPQYRQLVNESSAQLESAPLADVVAIVDRVGEAAGEQLWALAIGGGSAWKIEVALGRFYRQYLASQVEIDVRVLLAGFSASEPAALTHAVLSADWYWPTLGESPHIGPVNQLKQRRGELIERREAAEKACRQALQDKPELLHRFEVLLELAQRYAQLREEQANLLTLAWPLLRKCVFRLGTVAVASGAIDGAEDAFFLSRTELVGATGTTSDALQARVRERRADWERCRRLTPPLALGTMPKLLERMLGTLEVVRTERATAEGALRGDPASPGRASGRVRVIRGPSDFDKFQQDEVLVAQLTAPAWTPLFARAAAVVTDGGSLAAHASLVAREYGIPAVVATGDATSRLSDGQLVMVDGSAGLVEIQP
jgi:pyruvate,water dikinase